MSRPDGYLVPGTLDADAVVAEVARGFRVSVEDIMGPSRTPHIATARNCAMAVIRRSTKWSWSAIGDYFARDHSTIQRNVGLLLSDPEMSRAVELVVEELQASAAHHYYPSNTQKSRGFSTSNQQVAHRTIAI